MKKRGKFRAWLIKKLGGEIPTIINGNKRGCSPLQDGDIIGEGVRLNKKQVRRLIKELKKWLRRGY